MRLVLKELLLALTYAAFFAAALVLILLALGWQTAWGQKTTDRYEWRHGSNPDQAYLYKNGVQIGGYDYREGYFRPYDLTRDAWGDIANAPVEPPLKHVFGLDDGKLSGGETYTLCGPEGAKGISRQQAIQAIEKTVTDDSHKCRITVIGSTEQQAKVMADLAQVPGLGEWTVVRGYEPGHWALTTAGFSSGGSPTIYVQAPNGQVLHRQDDYQGGAAELTGALRKAKDGYDPKKDPDLRQRLLQPNGINLGGYLLALGAGVIGAFLFTKKKEVSA